MRLSDDRILAIAKKIAFAIVKKRLIRTSENQRQISSWIEKVILDDLGMEDKINDEVREMLGKMTTCPPLGSIDYKNLFQKKKEELAKRHNYSI